MKKMWIIFIIFLISCESKEKLTGLVDYATEPVIEDILLAKRIYDGMPQGIADYFYRGDTVNLWILWEESRDTHEITSLWFTPSGNLEDSLTLRIVAGKHLITIFSKPMAMYSDTGEWEIAVFSDGDFKASVIFYLDE